MTTIIKSSLIYDGKIIKVEKKLIKLPDNRTVEWEYVDHPAAVGIIAVHEDNILLVKQYRLGADKELLEIPAGLIEKDEDPLVCAMRELREETGYQASKFEFLGTYYLSPGYSNEVIHLFFATDLVSNPLPQDEDEFIHLTMLPVSELYDFINPQKKISISIDAKTALAISLYAQKNSLKS